MTEIKVACCQVRIDVGHPQESWDRVLDSCRQAAYDGANLVVAPELANSGYAFDSQAEAEERAISVPGTMSDQLVELSAAHNIVVVCGISEEFEGRLYSSAIVADRGHLLGVYRKSHLWDTEHNFFAAADDPPLVVETSVGLIGVAVCYDVEFPETVRLAVEQGAQILAVPVNWPLLPRPHGVWPIEVTKVMAHANEYQIPIAVADRCGEERGISWIGGTFIADRSGYPLVMPYLTEPSLPRIIAAPVHLSDEKQLSRFNHCLNDRRVDIYSNHQSADSARNKE